MMTDRSRTIVQDSDRTPQDVFAVPDARGHFGLFGGKYVPETLMSP
jgi:hypothetical protein